MALERLKNQPRLKVEGTWNFLFGGQNGACCTMNAGSSQKSSKRPYVFVGVGSQLRKFSCTFPVNNAFLLS